MNFMMADTSQAKNPNTVLIVEDDPSAARSLCFLMQHYGFRVQWAGTVKTAIALLDIQPDIILLDLLLPDGYGIAVMEAIKARNLTARVAVVSAVIDHAMLCRARVLGPEMMLSKPLNFLSLLEQLRVTAA